MIEEIGMRNILRYDGYHRKYVPYEEGITVGKEHRRKYGTGYLVYRATK